MNISNIHITLCNKHDSKLKALASFVVDNTIVVHNIKILGYTKEEIKSLPEIMHDLLKHPVVDNCHIFISMPSSQAPNGEYKDIVHPFNAEAKKYIGTELINAYINEKQAQH